MWLRAQPGTVILRIARRQSDPGHGAFGDGPEHRLPAGSPGPLLPRTAARYQRPLALGTGDHAGAAIVPARFWLVRGPTSQCGAGPGTLCQFLTMQITGRSTPGAGVEPLLADRSEEHTSELQSRENLVCRLLLEKKK